MMVSQKERKRNDPKKIQHLEKNPKTVYEYRKKSRNRILENYTWDKITNQYKTLFISLLNKH